MKKLKRIVSLTLALAMIFALSVSAYGADSAVPSSSDRAAVKIYNVESGVTLRAYQIIGAVYGTNGLTGYEVASGVELENMETPTSEEITAIAEDIYNGDLEGLETVALTYDSSTESYGASLKAGMWIILVWDSASVIYNPMIVSNWYTNANLASSLTAGSVDADGNFVEGYWTDTEDVENRTYTAVTEIYAKSYTLEVEKSITNSSGDGAGADYAIGSSVEFLVETAFPDYSETYSEVTFTVEDTLSEGLTFNDDINVKVGGSAVEESDTTYTVSSEENSDGTTSLSIAFASGYVLDNGAKSVEITYSAELNENAALTGGDTASSNANEVNILYSNNPRSTFNTEDAGGGDKVYIYTFSITDEIAKVIPDGSAFASGNDVTVSGALSGAEFTLYTDEDCTKVYSNSVTDGVMTTGSDGFISFDGLTEGTYYLTETDAPDDYMINDTVYKIVISAVYDTSEGSVTEGMLTSYTITVTDLDTGESHANTYTVSYSTSKETYTYTNSSSVSEVNYSWYEVSGASISASENPLAIVDPDLIKLPSTGGNGIYIVIGVSLVVLCVGALIVLKKKKHNNKA